MKLQIDGEVFPDPYDIDEKDWINDVTTMICLVNRLYAELHVIFFTHGIRIRPNAWGGIFH